MKAHEVSHPFQIINYYKKPSLCVIPTIAASRVYNAALLASYSRGVDLQLLSISGFIASEWYPTLSRELIIWGTATMGLKNSVGKSTDKSNQRSQVQTLVQSNFLCSFEIYLFC